MRVKQDKAALKKFYQQVGEKYPEEDEVYRTLRGRLRRKFVFAWLQTCRGPLLDIGCNRGMYLLAYRGGSRYGVDLSLPVMQKIPSPVPLHLAVADAERLELFRPGSFAHILCSEVLEHCLQPQAVFDGIAHVLKPGGRGLVTTPNYRGQKPDWIDLGYLRHFDVHSDCAEGFFHTAYRPEELEILAGRAGLAVVASGTLEREIKYAAKVPAGILLLGRAVNKLFRFAAFDRLNEALFNHLTKGIYYVCHYSGLEILLLKLFPEGVRSYIIVEK